MKVLDSGFDRYASHHHGQLNEEETIRDLNYELKHLCLRNRDGSYATQYARERILLLEGAYYVQDSAHLTRRYFSPQEASNGNFHQRRYSALAGPRQFFGAG
jgi:hypothetical protein